MANADRRLDLVELPDDLPVIEAWIADLQLSRRPGSTQPTEAIAKAHA